jgi:hypothetical protein
MSIRQQFEFKKASNNSLEFEQWIETLPLEQQQEFFEARERQLANRQKRIEEGYLSVDGSTYTWTDKSAYEEKNHGADPIWQKYLEQWLTETNTQIITTFTEE